LPGNRIIHLLIFILGANVCAQDVTGLNLFSKKKLTVNRSAFQEGSIELSDQKLEKKSVTKAFFLSLLLPGTGEAYVGKTDYTKVFMSIELAGWGLFIANRINVNKREEDYKNYAAQHAGLNRQDKTDQYWIDIGKFDNIYLYNEQRRRDRNVDAIYPENRSFIWKWDNLDSRLYYDAYRIDTRKIDERKIYIIGGIILNHLVSAVNALRVARAHNREIEALSWRLDFDYNPYAGTAAFTFQTAL